MIFPRLQAAYRVAAASRSVRQLFGAPIDHAPAALSVAKVASSEPLQAGRVALTDAMTPRPGG